MPAKDPQKNEKMKYCGQVLGLR